MRWSLRLPGGLPTKTLKAMRDGAQNQLAELEEQLAQYEALRASSADINSAPNSRRET